MRSGARSREEEAEIVRRAVAMVKGADRVEVNRPPEPQPLRRNAEPQRPGAEGLAAALEQALEADDLEAVLIKSAVLGAEVWLALREDWKPEPGDTRALFYASEIPLLKTKTAEELKLIHRAKLAFGPETKLRGPACWNCGAPMEAVTDLFGTRGFACWRCAKTA